MYTCYGKLARLVRPHPTQEGKCVCEWPGFVRYVSIVFMCYPSHRDLSCIKTHNYALTNKQKYST